MGTDAGWILRAKSKIRIVNLAFVYPNRGLGDGRSGGFSSKRMFSFVGFLSVRLRVSSRGRLLCAVLRIPNAATVTIEANNRPIAGHVHSRPRKSILDSLPRACARVEKIMFSNFMFDHGGDASFEPTRNILKI